MKHICESRERVKVNRMAELEKRIYENGIDYVLVGDCYIPDLKSPEEKQSIGRWGRMHREYLKESKPSIYTEMVVSGEIWTYLANLNEQAQKRLEVIIEQMKEAEGVNEELKRRDSWHWVQCMNCIRNRAEEIILSEMIYT